MVSKVRAHLLHNFVGYLALTVALGGTSYAAATVTSANIKNGTIRAEDIRDRTITRGKLQTAAVPSFSASTNNLGEVRTQDQMTVVDRLEVAADARYLVFASFTAGGEHAFSCNFRVNTSSEPIAQQTINVAAGSTSETIFLDVTPETGATAVLECADQTPNAYSNLFNPKVAAVRLS